MDEEILKIIYDIVFWGLVGYLINSAYDYVFGGEDVDDSSEDD
jgi:hypothetical protein